MRFFSKTQSIIHISRTRIKAARVVISQNERVETIQDTAWEEGSLLGILSSIRKKIGREVSIVLGEDLVYVASFPFSDGTQHIRSVIRQEAQKLIPENLDEAVWDFKIVNGKGVQVMVVSKFFMEHIAPGIAEAGFSVEALEAESCSLARMVRDRNDASLVICADTENNLLVIADHGVVMATESIKGLISMEHIERVVSSVRKRFFLDIKTIILSGEIYGILQQPLEEKGFVVESTILDPMVGIARKSDIKGKDDEVLNVDILPREPRASRLSSSERRLTAIFVTTLIVGAVVVSGVLVHRRDARIQKESAPVSQTSVAPAQSSQTEAPREDASQSIVSTGEVASSDVSLDVSRYSIAVLNGSGKRGAAADMRDILESKGFAVAKADNADKNTYTKTIVETKTSVPEEVVKKLLAAVSDSSYMMEDTRILEDTSESDVVIIIGSEKVQ